jgi:hypothetical protein
MTTLFDEFLARERQAIWAEECKLKIDAGVAEIESLERQMRFHFAEFLRHLDALRQSTPPQPPLKKETLQ